MVGNEGKTRIPVYDALTKAGFDPTSICCSAGDGAGAYGHSNFWQACRCRIGDNGVERSLVDGSRTNLKGLYAAGALSMARRTL